MSFDVKEVGAVSFQVMSPEDANADYTSDYPVTEPVVLLGDVDDVAVAITGTPDQLIGFADELLRTLRFALTGEVTA